MCLVWTLLDVSRRRIVQLTLDRWAEFGGGITLA